MPRSRIEVFLKRLSGTRSSIQIVGYSLTMGLSEEQERAIQSWRAREEDSKTPSTTPAYTSPSGSVSQPQGAFRADLGDQRQRPVGSPSESINPRMEPAATPTSMTTNPERPRSHRSLYLTILSALLGFNIFQSLFGRESSGGDECGSWFFPVLEEDGYPIGFFASGADRACPRYIAGTLTEAVVSALALAVVAATLYFTRESH